MKWTLRLFAAVYLIAVCVSGCSGGGEDTLVGGAADVTAETSPVTDVLVDLRLCTEDEQLSGYCDDNDPCTTSDRCGKNGVCGGQQLQCPTDKPCVQLSCDKLKGGCYTEKVLSGTQCNDFDECTSQDLCNDTGGCVGKVKTCEDGNSCTLDACDKLKGCSYKFQQGGPCDDGNKCTTLDTCDAGLCKSGNSKVCDDGNPCTFDACDPEDGVCTSNPTGDQEKCDDGNPCTEDDRCKSGKCASGQSKKCSSNPCYVQECNQINGQCDVLFVGTVNTTCSDGNSCTANDSCDEFTHLCQGKPKNCNDDKICTDDFCIKETGCQHKATDGEVCDDGDVCTEQDLCKQGVCKGSTKNCIDSNPCTADACGPKGTCEHSVTTGGSCDDNNACTKDDQCQSSGTCIGKNVSCNSTDCTSATCNPTSGCKITNLSNIKCDDGYVCTLDDTCKEGKCIAGFDSCNDGNSCTDDSCDAKGGCIHQVKEADKYTCSDNSNPCAAGLTGICKAGGSCALPQVCDDKNGCTLDVCDSKTAKCAHVPIPNCSNPP